jgi:hypothetical protein
MSGIKIGEKPEGVSKAFVIAGVDPQSPEKQYPFPGRFRVKRGMTGF